MRNNHPSNRGQAMFIALVVLLFILPLGVVLYNATQTAMTSAFKESQQKSSAQIATDVITDYMRAFSNDPYNGHYDSASLGRPLAGYYANSVSTVTFIANSSNHTVYLSVIGALGSSSSMEHPQHLSALIKFISPLCLFGTMFNQSTTLTANNSIYSGGFYVNGSYTESGTNVTWEGGPLIVNGTLTGSTGDTVDGNLYYTTAESGVTVDGNSYNYVPSFSWPTFDTNYYASQAGVTLTTSQTATFNSTGTVTIGTNTYTIPSNGLIIYANNTDISISGTISGMVTVVAYDSNATIGCGAGAGQINVTGNLFYAGASSVTATASNSFAALASNCINFQSNSNITTTGVYFVQGNGSTTMELQCASSCSNKSFQLFGTRSDPISTAAGFTSAIIAYDPGLRANQPPGLPEQAYLVNFNLH